MNVYEPEDLEPVPVAPVLKSKSVRTQLNELIENGGELCVDCPKKEFSALFLEFKPARRQCKLSMDYVDGKLYASSNL